MNSYVTPMDIEFYQIFGAVTFLVGLFGGLHLSKHFLSAGRSLVECKQRLLTEQRLRENESTQFAALKAELEAELETSKIQCEAAVIDRNAAVRDRNAAVR
eukprot:749336_1